jgi:hypothetical protein
VVARRQLLALGFGTEAIRHRVRSGRLYPVAAGVYAVGRRELTREGWWMAALLACGDDAVLSHGSAAALWGIGPERRGEIEVTVRRRAYPRREGVVVRARPSTQPRTRTAVPKLTAPVGLHRPAARWLARVAP